jgi:hypothetical protein
VIDGELELFLARLGRARRPLGRRERGRALREARDHLLCAADEREALGCPRREAVTRAIEAFGAVESIAAGYARSVRSRAELGAIAVGAVVLALAFAPTGSRIGQFLIPTSHAADSQCAGRWNARAQVTGYPEAWVSAPRPGCEVVLHDAQRALVFRQEASDGRWRAIVPAHGASWPLASIAPGIRAHAYAVDADGLIGRRLGG